MHVAVIIVGYRNATDVARCLGALGASRYADLEVLVCENGGEAAFADLEGLLPSRLSAGQAVRLVKAPRNLGYAGGINVGMAETPAADAWWILNPDTLPDAEALPALVARLREGDCDIAGGILYGADGRIQTAGGRWRPWLARAEALAHGRPLSDPPTAAEIEPEMAFVSGASMLVSRRFRESVGPMRDDYFLYVEEVEWCLRGRARGMRLGFTPDARVLHHQGATTGSASGLRRRPRLPVYLDERNKMLVTRDRNPWKLPVAAPAALALIALRFLGRGAWRQFGYGVSGWLDGLRGRRGALREGAAA